METRLVCMVVFPMVIHLNPLLGELLFLFVVVRTRPDAQLGDPLRLRQPRAPHEAGPHRLLGSLGRGAQCDSLGVMRRPCIQEDSKKESEETRHE